MPHLVILYSGNLDAPAAPGAEAAPSMSNLCRSLADTMLAVKDESGKQVFPTGGTRVLAYPAAHWAVADGKADYAFVYLSLRMARGRSAATHKTAGDALIAATREHFAPIFDKRHIGITLQIDEGAEVFDAKHSNLHPLFAKP